jgi:putative ATP-binding cassette transporter
MKLVWFLFKSSWITVITAAIAGGISGFCSAFSIALITQALRTSQNDQLLIGFVLLAIIAVLTNTISRFVLADLNSSAVYRLRLQLSQQILSCPLSQLESLGSNRILATLNEDINTLGISVSFLPLICINIAIVIGGLVYLLWLSWAGFLITTVILLIAIAIIQFLIGRAYKSLHRVREEQDKLFKHFRTITDGIKELKLHADRRTEFFTEDLKGTTAAVRYHSADSMKVIGFANSIGDLLTFLVMGLVVFALPKLISIDSEILSSYFLVLLFIAQPLGSLLQILPNLDRGTIALNKIETLGLSLVTQPENTTHTLSPQAFHQIDLVQISHTYHPEKGEPFTLGTIDLSIQAGELMFIVGGNGSGKSTLAKVMTGLYIPEQGEIRLDHQLITDQNRENYRQLFSTVFSDFYLFDRALGIHSDQLDKQAHYYLQQLQLDHKVQVEDGRLSTIDLSQGQRKRLALLTAYLEDRPIYLFDEWAADQDPSFREIFYRQLLPELKQRGKTVIAITHDDRYFSLADRILKLDYGQIIS